nr:helix-turn-helix transcriptional regulator [Pseudorhodoferax sp.]
MHAVVQDSGPARMARRHSHAAGQLLGAAQGLITVDVREGRWVVPAAHAVWLPPHTAHGLRPYGPFAGWSVYVAAPACAGLPQEPCLLATSALLREAVARATTWKAGTLDAAQARLAGVILDEVRSLPPVALGLPLPQDRRLTRIAKALVERPGDGRSLPEWAGWAGIAPRTLSRRFVEETGLSFTAWRQRLRLLRALEMLAAGRAVQHIALDLGYDNVSAFIALFKRSLGVTPGRYDASAR